MYAQIFYIFLYIIYMYSISLRVYGRVSIYVTQSHIIYLPRYHVIYISSLQPIMIRNPFFVTVICTLPMSLVFINIKN